MEKYPPDSLVGAYWERVWKVGFLTQRSLDFGACKLDTLFRLLRLVAIDANAWDNGFRG